MSTADWMDAGYVMLVENADPDARALFDDLFTSETEEEMLARFDVLQAEIDAREAEHAKQEREEAKRSGRAPRRRRTKRLAPGQIEAAAAEWDALIAEAKAK